MSVERETPPGGGEWLNNAEVYERHRVDCLERAERAEQDGDRRRGLEWRRYAAIWERQRDRVHAEGQRRDLNRRVRRRRPR